MLSRYHVSTVFKLVSEKEAISAGWKTRGKSRPNSILRAPPIAPRAAENPNRRKGWFLNPFCHLVIKTVRVDSHPFAGTIPNALIA